jgi:dihydrofolate synthase/folylpolyglutamate synthase
MFKVYNTLSLKDDIRPGFLQLMALVLFYIFLQKGVEVVIYETYHSGKFYATNVIKHLVVTVITSIGLDYIIDLGLTLENIVWYKAGILKRGVPALIVP